MDQKTIEILTAGWAMFARYGFAKTTMSDIAKEAGIARQTLYNAFPSKEEVLRAVVRHAGEQSLSAVTDEWTRSQSLEEKLAAFHTHGPINWFEAMVIAPDWGELMDGLHRASSEELRTLEETWVAELTNLFDDHAKANGQTETSPEELARFFYTTSKNAKHGVQNVAELKARLVTILRAALVLARAS
jgi:AcrR family transcriptional regulator